MCNRRAVVHLKRAGRAVGVGATPRPDVFLAEVSDMLDEVWADLEEAATSLAAAGNVDLLREASDQLFEVIRLLTSARSQAA
jgi:hypothetical protein